MRKNSDYKNINYVNYEMISMMITLLSCTFISYSPIRIIKNCGSASIIGILFLAIVTFIVYYFILKAIFKNEYDIFSVIKKSYCPTIQKIISVIIYLFILLYIYLLISNLLYNLRASIYNNSSIFTLSIFFLVALYLIAKKGFNVTFRVVGYISYIIILYILFLFCMAVYKIDLTNFLPLLGEGSQNVFLENLPNIGLFAPIFLFTFFGGKVANNKKRSNYKNFGKIMLIFTICYAILLFTFIGTVPIEIISSRYTLLLDLSSLISLSPLYLKLTPIMVFVFSFLIFISSAFCLLCGLYNIQRLNVVKDYSKYVLPSVIILTIAFLIPIPLSNYNNLVNVFYILSIAITFVFPILTLFIYNIRNKGGTYKFKEDKNMPEIIEEID